MSSERTSQRLLDIIENAESISRYTAAIDNARDFERDTLVYDAVERCLGRICEAIAKLGDQAPTLLPGQPWQRIRAFGNILRHVYDNIVKARVWSVVRDDLPSLVNAYREALKALQQ